MCVFVRVSIACFILLLLTAASAAAQDTSSARVFLESIYKNYGKGGPGVNFNGRKARTVFSSSLIALEHADQKAVGPNEVGVLDGDPVCGCQDWDSLHDLKIAFSTDKPGMLRASVSFALFKSDAAPGQSLRALEMTRQPKGSVAHRQYRRQI